MVTPSTVLTIPFRSGIGQDVDPAQAPPGTLTALRNAVWARTGEIRKRRGVAAVSMSDGSASLAPKRLLVRGDELACVVTNASTRTRLYSYRTSLATWRNTGEISPFSASWQTLSDSVESITDPEIAVSGTLLVMVWRSGNVPTGESTGRGSLYVQVLDVSTYAVIMPPTLLIGTPTFGWKPRLVITGGFAVIAAGYNATDLRVWRLNLTTLAAPSLSAALATFGASGTTAYVYGTLTERPALDMMVLDSDNVLIAYADVANPVIKILTVKVSTLGVTASVSLASYAAVDPVTSISMDGTPGGVVFVAWATYSGAAIGTYLGAWNFGAGAEAFAVVVLDPIAAHRVAVMKATAKALVVWGGYSGVYDSTGVRSVYSYADGQVLTRPFQIGDVAYAAFASREIYVPGAFNIALQPASVFVGQIPLTSSIAPSYEPIMAMASIAPRLSGQRTMTVSNPIQVSTEWLLVTPASSAQCVEVGNQQAQISRLATADDSTYASVNFAQEDALVACAIPCVYDGASMLDVGFGGWFTVTGTLTNQVVVGASMPVGVYGYAMGIERRDARGLLHRSPTWVAGTVTLAGADNSVRIGGFPSFTLTGKQRVGDLSLGTTAPYWVLYRTDSGGSTYYKTSNPPGLNAIKNASTSPTLGNLDDTLSLAAVPNRTIMYTTGGVVDDEHPPGFLDVRVHRNRLFGVSGDKRTIWFSKSILDDPGLFPGFNDALTFRVDDGGDVVAIASHASVLLVFTTTGVYYVEGDGPGPNALQSDYTPPRRIAAGQGCSTARSVVSAPDGTYYLGTDGILCLINHGLQAIPVGLPVQDTIATYTRCTSAVLVEAHSQVRWTFRLVGGTTGVSVVYDYQQRQWSTFDYTLGGVSNCGIEDAVMWNGLYTILSQAGSVFTESASNFLDVSAWVTLQIEGAWITSGGLTAWQRVRRLQTLGTYQTAHGLTVELAVDGSSSYQQTATFTEAHTLVNRDVVTVHLGSQNGMNPRNKAIRFRITDTTPVTVGTGEGARFSGVGLEIVPRSGVGRHGAAGSKV